MGRGERVGRGDIVGADRTPEMEDMARVAMVRRDMVDITMEVLGVG